MRYAVLAALSVAAAACSEAPPREPAAPAPLPTNSYGVPYGIWVDDTAATAVAIREGRIQNEPICIDTFCAGEVLAKPDRGLPAAPVAENRRAPR